MDKILYLHKFSMVHEGGARTDYLSVAVLEAMSLELATCNKKKCKHVYITTCTSEVSLMKKVCLERKGEHQSLNYAMVWSILPLL